LGRRLNKVMDETPKTYARSAVQKLIAEERERCAKIAEEFIGVPLSGTQAARIIANDIRRTKKETPADDGEGQVREKE
jgi:hypothetical protein